ncbi:hypothetical protein [Peribacillus frigoritolerans]|uniref:hypothetical protein n=1 Tax=Peribacillus frigoritolerans TaxID=450367 RepID=UPI003C6E7141
MKQDEENIDIFNVKVQVVSFQGSYISPYMEEIITFKIVGNKIKQPIISTELSQKKSGINFNYNKFFMTDALV